MAQAPQARGYEQQVRPGRTAPLPDANPEAFGASIGTAIGQIGARVFDQAKDERSIELQQRRATEAADAGVRFAEVSGRLESDATTMRSEAAQAAAAHGDNVAAKVTGARDEFLGGLTNDQVRDTYWERFASMGANLIARERGWEVEQRVKYQVDGLDRAGDLQAKQAALNPTPEALELALGNVDALRVGLPNVPDDVADQSIRQQRRKVQVAWFNNLNDNGHQDQALIALRNAGATSDLTAQDLDAIRDGAHVEVRRAAVAAEAMQREQRQQAHSAMELYRTRSEAGEQLSDDDYQRWQQLATTFGDPADAYNAARIHIYQQLDRQTSSWRPPDWDRELNALRANPHRTPEEDVSLAYLERRVGGATARFNSDPQGFAAQNGNAPPPLDLNAPTRTAIDARRAWAEGYARANHMASPPYLSDAEMEQTRQLAGPTLPGQLQVAQELTRNWGAGPALSIAQRLAPNNHIFQLATTMQGDAAVLMARGAAAIDRDHDRFFPNRNAGGGVIGVVGRQFRMTADDAHRIFAQVEGAFPQDMRGDLFNAAVNIAAGMTDLGGGQGVPESALRMAIHLAAGGVRQGNRIVSGGLHERNGSLVWLPPNLSGEEFDRQVDRRAGSGPPAHFGGGRVLTVAEWRRARFETVAPGLYRALWTDGGILLGPNGQPFMLDMRGGQ